jgi:hypothetical protein
MADVAMLLGAGASVDAGMPTSEGMVEKLLDDFRDQSVEVGSKSRHRLLEFVVYSLKTQAASRGDLVGVDVETMFDAIETLASRTGLPIAPFISAWQPLVAEAERTAAAAALRQSPERRLARLLETAITAKAQQIVSTRTAGTNEAENFIRELIGAGDAAGSAFAGLAEAVLEALVRVLRLENPEKVRYLAPLIDLFRAQGHLDIATLNYDVTVERLGDLLEVPVETGMDDWSSAEKLSFGAGVRLFKLHGSIDWKLTRHPVVTPDIGKLPYETISRQKELVPDKPALIFGAGNKLRAGGPYLDLLRHFKESLEQCQAQLVVGYSFRDEHVNAILTNWMNADGSRRMVILDRSADRFNEFVGYSAMTLGHYLAWLAGSQPKRVKLMQLKASDGLSSAIEAARQG